MWNCHGQQCHICLKAFEDECQPNDSNYRKKILLTCSLHLFSEFGIDWSSISTEENLPFCAQCLENIEQIIKYSDGCERIQGDIKSCVQVFMIKSLRSRKQRKDKGVTLPASLTSPANSRVKVEVLDHQTCVVCYNFYTNDCQNEQLTFESKKNILDLSKEYFYSDFISNSGGFDWNSIPDRLILPFCANCYLTIDKICRLGNFFTKEQNELNEFLDSFFIEAFESRDALKKKTSDGGISTSSKKLSVSVDTGKTTIVINNNRPTAEADDSMVSASDEQVPRIVETTTLSRPEDVSSSNQSGPQSDLPRKSGNFPSKRTISKNAMDSGVRVPNTPNITKNRIFEDAQLVINSVSNIVLPPGTSIEELPPSSLTNHGSEVGPKNIKNVRSSSTPRKSKKKKRFRYSEDRKIRTRSRCGKCNRNFTYERNYYKHKETCRGLESYSAAPATSAEVSSPEVSFAEMPQLQVEYSNYPDVQMETVSDSFICTYQNCGKRFQKKEHLQRHIVLHTANRPHQCEICKATFVQTNHLKNHIKQHKPKAANARTIWSSAKKSKGGPTSTPGPSSRSPRTPHQFSCIYCDFNGNNSTVLSKHLQSHADIAHETICSICNLVCASKYTLKRHLRRKHSIVGDFDQIIQLLNLSPEVLPTPAPKHKKRKSTGLWVKSGFAQSD